MLVDVIIEMTSMLLKNYPSYFTTCFLYTNHYFIKFTYHHIEKLMYYLMHLIIIHRELFPMCCNYSKTAGSNDCIQN